MGGASVVSALWEYVKLAAAYLKVGMGYVRIVAGKGWQRVALLWNSGVWQYVGISLFVVIPLRTELVTMFSTGDPVPLFAAVGRAVGSAWFDVTGALARLPGATGVEYATLGWTVLTASATILWYFKTWQMVVRGIEGPDVSPQLIYGTAALLFFVLTWAVTDRVPLVGEVSALDNVRFLFEWRRLLEPLPFVDGAGAVNGSVNQTLQNASTAVNATSG